MTDLNTKLAETLDKVGNKAPELIEKILNSYTEVNIVSTQIEIISSVVIFIFCLIGVIVSLAKDEYGGGGICAAIFSLLAVLSLIFFVNALSISFAPEAYAIKQLTQDAFGVK
jgi:hypothetical protein